MQQTPVTTLEYTDVVKNKHPKVDDKFIEDKVVNKPVDIVKPVVNNLSSEQLLSCLYFIFDAMERCGLDFFLVKQTAHDAMKDIFAPLTGDSVHIGIRKLEWQNDQKDLLFPYFDQEHVEQTKNEPDLLEFKWHDIPFSIHLYDDNECLTALVGLVYQQEHWKIPNQFPRFEKEFDK